MSNNQSKMVSFELTGTMDGIIKPEDVRLLDQTPHDEITRPEDVKLTEQAPQDT